MAPWWNGFWQYLTSPTGPSLGRAAWLVIGASVVVGGMGIVLAAGPSWLERLLPAIGDGRPAGPNETVLRTELRVKAGAGIAVWCGALILSLLMRVLGTPGLTNRLLPGLVVVALPLLVGYLALFRARVYPELVAVSRRVDKAQSYQAGPRGSRVRSKRTSPGVAAPRRKPPRIELMAGKATLGFLLGSVVYYMVMLVPTGDRYHDLHQFGIAVAAPIGYLVGLALSLGDDVRASIARPGAAGM